MMTTASVVECKIVSSVALNLFVEEDDEEIIFFNEFVLFVQVTCVLKRDKDIK